MATAPLLLSLEVAILATMLVAIVGIAAASLLATVRFRGSDLLELVLTAPLVMPPTVLGYYVLVAIGRSSFVGRAFESLTGAPIVFTKLGAVVAASIGALPLVVKSVRAALESVDPSLVAAARTLGASPLRALFTISLPLANKSIASSLMLAFARSVGDFGLTLMIAGDIPGHTQTASLAIYDALAAGREGDAKSMIVVLTLLVSGILLLVGKLSARAEKR